ncbi:MAG: hypothetical protein ACJ77K_03245 [Bacteroidia bacterium]
MGREYNPIVRIHDPAYLTVHSKVMKEMGMEHKSSSSLIYACLDLRGALELIEYGILLASVDFQMRQRISELTAPKNGLEVANKELKSLKSKFQYFYQAVCEICNVPGTYFDMKKSRDLQYRLSQYLHTYTRTQEEITFGSEFMNAAAVVIDETLKFIDDSLRDGESYTLQCIEIAKIPAEDKLLLEEWKNSTKMTYEELKERLQKNADVRIARESV